MSDKQPRTAREVLNAELLQALRHHAQTQTEFLERLAGGIFNNVLDAFTDVFGTDPVIAKSYNVAAGAVTVDNLSAANVVTVVGAGRAPGAAPDKGVGVFRVPPATRRTFSIHSHEVTLYGTAADAVVVQVFTAAARPVAG